MKLDGYKILSEMCGKKHGMMKDMIVAKAREKSQTICLKSIRSHGSKLTLGFRDFIIHISEKRSRLHIHICEIVAEITSFIFKVILAIFIKVL